MAWRPTARELRLSGTPIVTNQPRWKGMKELFQQETVNEVISLKTSASPHRVDAGGMELVEMTRHIASHSMGEWAKRLESNPQFSHADRVSDVGVSRTPLARGDEPL